MRYSICPTPARMGANVRTIGINRARTMVFLPYFFVKRPCTVNMLLVKKERIFAVKNLRPDFFPERVSDTVPQNGAYHTTNPQQQNIEVSLRGKKSRGKEKRVARQEKTEKQSGLREDNDEDANEAKCRYQKLGVDVVKKFHNIEK